MHIWYKYIMTCTIVSWSLITYIIWWPNLIHSKCNLHPQTEVLSKSTTQESKQQANQRKKPFPLSKKTYLYIHIARYMYIYTYIYMYVYTYPNKIVYTNFPSVQGLNLRVLRLGNLQFPLVLHNAFSLFQNSGSRQTWHFQFIFYQCNAGGLISFQFKVTVIESKNTRFTIGSLHYMLTS